MDARPLSKVPRAALALLVAALAAQLMLHVANRPEVSQAQALHAPPSIHALRLASLGEPIAVSRLLMLRLQGFDSQPGIRVPFAQFDYDILTQWLDRILELDPNSQYPLFMASRLYGEVADPERQRVMLEFVYQRFQQDPNRRWPWLAHAATLAKHRLHDLPLALKYARAIRMQATGNEVPGWARQMEIFVLEDMNEIESAKILLGGLLDSGQITDPQELRFLTERLREMQSRSEKL